MKNLLILLFFCQLSTAQVVTPPVVASDLQGSTVALRPAAGRANRVWIITDGNSASDCTVGGGSNTVQCRDNGATWVALGGGAASTASTRRVCPMVIGADNGAALADADIGPQKKQCQIPYAATIVEIDVSADGGTPNVIPAVRHCTVAPCVTGANETVTNIVSSALATAASGGSSCSKTGATAGFDTFTTCSATLQNTSIAAGDYIELVSGTAGGTAKRMSIMVHFTVN